MLKKILSFLLVLALSLSLFSCMNSPKKENGGSDEEETTDAVTAETGGAVIDGVTVFKKSEAANFKVVYSREMEADAMTAVNKLVDKINSVCEVDLVVTNDYVLESDTYKKEWDHEILIGKTNREESASFGVSYRPYDYGYGYENGKIIIYSKSDAFLDRAVNAFLVNVILKNQKNDVFYQSDWTSMEQYHYAVGQLTVNGVDLGDYEIIYPENSELFEKEMATRLQCYIVEMTGHELPIKKDCEARETANAFLIGKTNGSADLTATALVGHEGGVSSNGTDIAVYGNTMTAISNASKYLTDLLFDVDEPGADHSVTVSGSTKVQITEDHYSTMTFNLYTANQTDTRKDRVINTILRYLPDTVGVQEVDATWMNELRTRLSDYYSIVGEGREGGNKGEAVPILYAKERYDLIESGTKWFTDTPDVPSKMPGADYYRNYTWVLLEDKDTQTRYLHLNVHLDTAGSAIRYAEAVMMVQFLQQYNDVAVVITGDMNAKITSEEMKLLRSYNLKTGLDYPDTGFTQTNPVDWIKITSDCMTMTEYVVDDVLYNGAYASDHYAFYSEFTLMLPENGKIDHNWDVEPSNYPDEWLKVSVDKVGSYYAPPQSITAADRDANGHVGISDSAATVELDGVIYHVIRTVDEMNAAAAAGGKNFILANDLDYTGKTFKRIKIDNKIFDGNGYAIYGYELSDAGNGISTFARPATGSSVTVRNLSVGKDGKHIFATSASSGSSVGAVFEYSDATHLLENVTVYANVETTKVNVGGIMGNTKGTLTMRNCKFYGSVTDDGAGYVGGMIGKVNSLDLTVENCENHGTVSSIKYAGGIAGNVSGTSVVTLKNSVNYGALSKAEQIGGMIGNLNYTGSISVQNCENRGTVNGTKYLGGMLGGFAGTPKKVELLNCANYQTVSGEGVMGGMIGYLALNAESGGVTVDGCVNHGPISGNSNDGGIIGSLVGSTPNVSVTKCLNFGVIKGGSVAGIVGGVNFPGKLTVDTCLNFGSVNGRNAGGLLGWFGGNATTKLQSCVNLGALNGSATAGGLVASSQGANLTVATCASFASVTGKGNCSATIATQNEVSATVSALYGTAVEKDSSVETVARTTVTLEEALAWMNGQFQTDFGAFLLNSDGNGIVLATPQLVAFQQGATEDNSNDLRLIGGVFGNTLRYASIGFEIEVDGNATEKEVTRVHRKLNASTQKEATAGEYGATFLFAVEIEDLIPSNGTVTVSVTAYAKALDGETVYRGNTYLVTFTDGVFDSAVVDTK